MLPIWRLTGAPWHACTHTLESPKGRDLERYFSLQFHENLSSIIAVTSQSIRDRTLADVGISSRSQITSFTYIILQRLGLRNTHIISNALSAYSHTKAYIKVCIWTLSMHPIHDQKSNNTSRRHHNNSRYQSI